MIFAYLNNWLGHNFKQCIIGDATFPCRGPIFHGLYTGPDHLATAEARARSPAGGPRTIRHHFHIPHLPRPGHPGHPVHMAAARAIGQPSSRARLDVARDMIRRARVILDRLDDSDTASPTQEESPGGEQREESGRRTSTASSSTPAAATATHGPVQPGVAVPFGTIQISATATSGDGAGQNPGELPPGLAQAISGIVQGAISGSLGAPGHGQPGQPIIASVRVDSFSVDPSSGQVVHNSPSHSTPSTPRVSSTGGSPSERPASAQEMRGGSHSSPQEPNHTSPQGQGQQQQQGLMDYPQTTEMADIMAEYGEANERLRPHWDAISEVLRSNSVLEGGEMAVRRQQVIFNQVTHVMHLLSHAQHAISDMMVNFSLPPPRVIRSRPIILQSAGPPVGAVMVPVPSGGIRSMGAVQVPRTAAHLAARGSSTSSSATSQSPTQSEPMMTSGTRASNASPSTSGETSRQNQQPASGADGVQVSMAPLVVGIEVESIVEGGDSPAAALGENLGHQQIHNQHHVRQHQQQHDQAFLENMIQAAIGGLNGNRAGQATDVPSSSASSGSPGASSSESEARSQTQARGNMQTQPTTSTQTRSTTQVHYGPPPPLASAILPPGIPVAPPNSFDPFLPCNSHHLPVQRARSRPPPGLQRPRSASVPPRRDNGENPATSQTAGTASARPGGSPQIPRRNIAGQQFHPPMHPPPLRPPPPAFNPLLANILQQNWDNRQNVSGSQQQVNLSLDPSILGLLQELQQAVTNRPSQTPGPAADEANMIGMIQGLLGQIMGAMTGTNPNPITVGEFLTSLPDYTYVEGEGLLTDLLMALARHITFQDIIHLMMGGEGRVQQLRAPLRNFVMQHIVGRTDQVAGSNEELSREEVEVAVTRFADAVFPEMEEMARAANVSDNIDFAETLYEFLVKKLIEVTLCILNETDVRFASSFLTLVRQTGAQFTALCQHCFTDGMASLERLLENRLSFISEDVGPTIRQWTLSTAVGHLRNYVATVDVPEAVVARFVITAEEGTCRRERRTARTSAGAEQKEEDEHFATPRSSPEIMETDEGAQREPTPSSSSTPRKEEEPEESIPFAIPPPVGAEGAVFPQALLQVPGEGPDMVVGSEAWHRAVPPEWVPIIARDSHTQERERSRAGPGRADDTGGSYSDAYLSTQPAKRRKLASEGKAAGTARDVVRESLREAIVASGVQPASSAAGAAQEIAAEATAVPAVEESTVGEIRERIRRRLDGDPDFEAGKFPEAVVFMKDD